MITVSENPAAAQCMIWAKILRACGPRSILRADRPPRPAFFRSRRTPPVSSEGVRARVQRKFGLKKIYVGNLSYRCSDDELRDLFTQYGTVVSASVVMDRDTGRSRGFGFVEMDNDANAATAIESLNGKEHSGRTLNVNEARPREPRSRASW